jgi:hypothetical protein
MGVEERLTTRPEMEKKGMSDGMRIILLLIGDALVFLIFSAIGRRSHGEEAGFDAFLQIVWTAAPFAIGWFVTAPFTGAYRRGLEVQPGRMAAHTLLSWIPGWVVGFALRGLLVDHAVPPLTFGIVSFVSNAILLLLWRLPFAWFNKGRSQR